MLRLTKRMEDGSYQANDNIRLPGENSYEYKDLIINRCGKSEDLINDMLIKMNAMVSEEDQIGFVNWLRHELSYSGFIHPFTLE